MSKSKIAVLALAAVTVAVTLFFTLAPRPDAGAPRPDEVRGLVVRGYDEGSLTWETAAGRGEMNSAAGRLEDVVLRVFEGRTTLELRAAQLTQEDDRITLVGDVRAETNDGLRVSSDEMTWQEDARSLGSGPTRLSLRGDELTADSFHYDARTQSASLGAVKARLARETSLAASSDRGEISRDTVRLLDNVRVYSTEPVQSGSSPVFEVAADALTLSRDGVTASGNVSADIEFASGGNDRGT